MSHHYVVNVTADLDYYLVTTEPPSNNVTTAKPYDADDAKYLVVPLVVIGVVMVLSILVYFMAKRRRLNKLKHDIRSLYDFDSNEHEWESLNSYENQYYSGDLNVTSNV